VNDIKEKKLKKGPSIFCYLQKIKNKKIKTEKRIKNSNPFVFFLNSVNPSPFFCFSFDNQILFIVDLFLQCCFHWI